MTIRPAAALANVVATLVGPLAFAAQTLSGPAPGFTLASRDGQVSLASLKGNVVLVNFWATWCVPCPQKMPHLQALYERYQSLGFELFADPGRLLR